MQTCNDTFTDSYSGILCFNISRETMNGERYKRILIDNRHRKLFFQQDRAPCHYAFEVRRILDDDWARRWISRRGSIKWPARSPDLTPCN